MQPLINVGPGQQLEAGLFSERESAVGPFWYDGKNVLFRNLGAEKSKGYSSLAPAFAPINSMAQAFVEGERRVYFANHQGNIRLYREPAKSVGTLGTVNPAHGPIDLEVWGSWLLIAQPGQPLKVWKNTGGIEPLDGPMFEWATIIKRKDEHVIAFNTDNGGNWAEWCSISNVELWESAPGNTAGDLPFRDLDSEIIAVKDLGPALGVYSRGSMSIMNYIGRPNIFGKRLALRGIGAVSKDSVIPHEGRNFGLMKQGIFVTDGVQVQFIDYPAMSGYVDREIDWDTPQMISGYYDSEIQMLRWSFRAKDGTLKGIGFDPVRRALTKFEEGIYVGLPKEVFDRPLLGLAQSLGVRQDVPNALGLALPFSIRTKPLDAGDAMRYKLWQMYQFIGDWDKVKLRIGVQQHGTANEPDQWVFDGPLEPTIYFEWEAPFIVLEFSSNEIDSSFSLSHLLISGQVTGAI